MYEQKFVNIRGQLVGRHSRTYYMIRNTSVLKKRPLILLFHELMLYVLLIALCSSHF